MTGNLEDKLHQEECKQWKGAKICVSIGNSSVKNAPKFFCIIFARQNMQNQTKNKCKTFH